MDLPYEILNIILSQSDNYYCLTVCKLWHEIIMKNSVVCDKCGKVVKSYDNDLWITDILDRNVCHGYYGTLERYRILRDILFKYPKFLSIIKRKSLGLWLQAVKYSSFPYDHIKNIPKEWYAHAIKINPEYVTYIKNPTYEMYLDGVIYNGNFLKHVPEEHHTNELCLAAIMEDECAISYVKNHSEKLWLDYIKLAWHPSDNLLKFVENPTEEICIQAYQKIGSHCIGHIKFS